MNTHTQICTNLVDSLDLTQKSVVFRPGAARTSMCWQVHAHHMLTFREILKQRRMRRGRTLAKTASLTILNNSEQDFTSVYRLLTQEM